MSDTGITKIYFAADHAGFFLKNELLMFVKANLHLNAEDLGAFTFDKLDDYPTFVIPAAKKLSDDIANRKASRAIIIGGSGQAEAVLANKFKGVRCAVFYGGEREQKDSNGNVLGIISASRLHDNTNAIALGARTLSLDEAKVSIKLWLETPFSNEERHKRRVAKIDEL